MISIARPRPTRRGKALRTGATGQDAERHFHLIDLGFAAHAEAHVERRRQFAAAAADAAFDLRDRHFVHRAEAFAHRVIVVQFGIALRRFVRRELQNQR